MAQPRDRRQFDTAYKTQVVGLIVSGRESRNDICQRLDLRDSMVNRWCRLTSLGGNPKAFQRNSGWSPGQEQALRMPPKSVPEQPKLPVRFFPAEKGHTLTLEEKLIVVAFCYASRNRTLVDLCKDIGKVATQVKVWLKDEDLGGSDAQYQERFGRSRKPEREGPESSTPRPLGLPTGNGFDPGSGLPTRQVEAPPAQHEPQTWQRVPGAPAKPVATAHACPNCHHPLDLSDVNRGAPNHVSL